MSEEKNIAIDTTSSVVPDNASTNISNRIEPVQKIVAIAKPDVKKLFNGEPYVVWLRKEITDEYHKAKHVFRNILQLDSEQGNESIVDGAKKVFKD